MNNKQNLINTFITFITSTTFLILTLFLFELFEWNFIYDSFTSLLKVGLLFGFLNVGVQYLSTLIIAFRMRSLIQKGMSLQTSNLTKIIIFKLFLEFILSALMIWVSIETFSNEVIYTKTISLIGLIVSTLIIKGIFSMTVAYQQNKDQLGGLK